MIQSLRRGYLALLLLAAFGVRAEVAYVSEGIKLGIHREAALTSAILALLPASTALEVLEEKDELVKVRLGDGMEGWVDGRYLSKNLSPSKKAAGLESELVQTATELAKARELAADLEYQLNREKERARIMEADLLKARAELEKEPSNDDANGASAGVLKKLRGATEENRRLKKRIDELESRLTAAVSDSGKTPVVMVERNPSSDDDASLWSRYTAITEWQIWQIMLLFFGLLLAFAVGAFVVDWEVRRRHGGFRV
jgi:SH3 domain protein